MKEKYRVLTQVQCEDDTGRFCINAGEELPTCVLENKELMKVLLKQNQICRIGKDGENIIFQEIDEFGREIYSDHFIIQLLNPYAVRKVSDFLDNHKLCRKNLMLLKEKIDDIKLKNPNNMIFDPLIFHIERQLFECAKI